MLCNPVCRKTLFLPSRLSWHLCQKSKWLYSVGPFLDFLFSSMNLYIYLYLILLLCRKFWEQVFYVLKLCSSCSKLFWLTSFACPHKLWNKRTNTYRNKNHWDIDWEPIVNLQMNLWRAHNLAVIIISAHGCGLSLHLFSYLQLLVCRDCSGLTSSGCF